MSTINPNHSISQDVLLPIFNSNGGAYNHISLHSVSLDKSPAAIFTKQRNSKGE